MSITRGERVRGDQIRSAKKRGRVSAVSAPVPFWPVQLARAVPALVVGLLITFSVDHSATFGLIVFGIFALTTGIILGWGASRIEDRVLRLVSVVHAVVAVLAIAVLLVPADYAAPWTVVDEGVTATGILTSQIVVVGIVGAYAFLIGVYLVIGGLSARWAAHEDTESATPVTGE